MEPKKHMLRKTAAFAAALSFLSATNLNILNSAAESSTVKKQAIASTVKELNNNVSSAQSEQTPSAGTTKSTTTTTTTTSTTTTTTTTVPVTKSTDIVVKIDVNGRDDILDHLTNNYKTELQKKLNDLSKYISVGTKSSSLNNYYPQDIVTIIYPEALEDEVKDKIKNFKAEKIEYETYYVYGYNTETNQWEYKRYYKLAGSSEYVEYNVPDSALKKNGNDSYVSENYEFSNNSFTVKKREYYLDDFSGIKPTGKVTINNNTINLNGKEYKVKAAKVTININLKNCNIDNKDKMTYTFEWQELGWKYVTIKAKDANNLIINDKWDNPTKLNGNNVTVSLFDLIKKYTDYYADTNTDPLPKNGDITFNIYASPAEIGAQRVFQDSEGVEDTSLGDTYSYKVDQDDNITVPYIVNKNGKNYYLTRERSYVLKNVNLPDTGEDSPNRDYRSSKAFSATEICSNLFSNDSQSYHTIDAHEDKNNFFVELQYREFPDTEIIDSDPLIELFANSLNGTINDDVIFAKRPAPAGEDNKRTISLNLPGYAGHEIIIVDDDNNSTSVKVTADASNAAVGKAVYEVKDDTKFVKVVLVKKIGNKDVPVDTQPFFVYFDDHQPEIKIKNNPNRWSNENNYKIDFTVNDEDDLSSVHPLFYADAEKIKKLEELKAIKYISILEQKGRSDAPLITYEHRFNIPDGIDDTVGQYTLSEATSQEGKNELNVKLIKQLDEDEKPYFTAEFSMADSEAKGYRGHVYIYAASDSGIPASFVTSDKKTEQQVMIDIAAPTVTSITAAVEDSDENIEKYIENGKNIKIKAIATDKYEDYPYCGVDKITYHFNGQDIIKEKDKINEEARFIVNTDNCNDIITITASDGVGNSDVFYYCNDPENGNVTKDISKAERIVVDNIPPAKPDLKTKNADYSDNGKNWYKEYTNILIKAEDEGETANISNIAELRFIFNNIEKNITAAELCDPDNNGFSSADILVSELAKEDSCYLHFVQDENNSSRYLPYLRDNNYPSVNIKLTDSPIDIYNDGKFELKMKTVDNAKNESEFSSIEFFIDNNAPTSDGIFEKGNEEHSENVDGSIHMYKYGTFSNHRIQIKVPVSDGQGTVPTSGYRDACLTVIKKDGSQVSFFSKRFDHDSVIFELPDTLNENEVFSGTMEMYVTDNVGNRSVSTKLVSPEPDSSEVLILERVAPVIPDAPELKGNDRYTNGEGQIWFSSDVTLNYNISDADSGLARVDIVRTHEGEAPEAHLTNEYIHKAVITQSNVHTASTADGKDGKFDFNVYAEDNAGNRSENSFTVYKDTSTPYIYSFSFSGLVKNSDSEIWFNKAPAKYGHFHNSDYIMTVTVKDDLGASSGIKNIYCELYNDDGSLFRSYVFDASSFRSTGEADTYSADFIVPEGFKGDIRAWAVDNVAHESQKASPNGFISENKNNHDNASYSHVTITLPSTAKRDTSGRPLYNQNVEAKIEITDLHSGIEQIRWRTSDSQNWMDLRIDANGNISGNTEGWEIQKNDRNIIQSISKNIIVSKDANDDFIQVAMKDNSQNISEAEARFSIDKHKPVIAVSGIEKSDQVKYYNTHKTAHVVISERNFDSPSVNGTVDTRFADDNSTDKNSDQFRHTRDLPFNSDGRYNLNITDTDLAGNTSDAYASGTFVIDTIAPKASVTVRKDDGVIVANGKNTYIESPAQATVVVDEVNFDPNLVSITINGKAFAPSGWSGTNSHSASIPVSYFTNDGSYTISVSGKDLAGNTLKTTVVSFTVDKKEPEINITGVSSANKDTVAPVVNIKDSNLDSQNVKVYRNGQPLKLTTENNGQTAKYDVDGSGSFITANWVEEKDNKDIKKKLVFDNFPTDEVFDGSYRIEVETADKAENTSSEKLEFTVNRHGSVFAVQNAEDINGKYLNKAPTIVITERNVDKHNSDSEIIIIVDKGSNTVKLTGSQYEVSEPVALSDNSGYEYTYTILPEVFDQDLNYNISIQSVDAAGNKNVSSGRGAEVSFDLDTQEPEFKCDGLSDKAEFRESEKEFRINVNERIKHIKVTTSSDEVLLDIDPEDGENSYVFKIPASNSSRDLTIELTDLAGNTTVKTYSDLLITENVALYMMHKSWVKITGISVLAGLGAIGGLLFVRKKRKNR